MFQGKFEKIAFKKKGRCKIVEIYWSFYCVNDNKPMDSINL
jgi:hypothetical protein